MLENLATPTLLLDVDRMDANIARMQKVCGANGVQLWPHIKTHKTVEIAQKQLAAGAQGLTVAKMGEAEALLPSGVRRVFLAHSLVDPNQAERLRALADSLDELLVAATSAEQTAFLEKVVARAGVRLPVLMAVDTGLGREGARGVTEARKLAYTVSASPHLELRGLYTHEGHAYAQDPNQNARTTQRILEQLVRIRDYIDPKLTLWPGCSVTAGIMATLPDVTAVRPGAYVLGDIALAKRTQVMGWDDVAVTILATVIDRPTPELALIDAGSKTFSGDKTPQGLSGSLLDGRDIHVTRVNEEHGYLTGSQVNELEIGERVRVVPAHICPVMNLSDTVTVVQNDAVVDTWCVAARGRVQ